MAGNNRAASMEKKKEEEGGNLDNRAGDSRTIAALFSIRHYLIHRVAGLIVPGGYFQAWLCVGHRQYSLQPLQREPALFFSPLFVFCSALNCGWLRTNCLPEMGNEREDGVLPLPLSPIRQLDETWI